MPTRRTFIGQTAALIAGAAATACDPREYARAHGATLRLSVAAGNIGGVFYPYGGAIASVISKHVTGVAATAEVTGGTIDNLQFIRQGTADLAFATADMLDEAYRGVGEFSKVGRVPARALAMLYYSYLHTATLDSTGITSLADLRGKVVNTGSPGSSTEVIAMRVLRAAGVDPDRDVRRQGLGLAAAVDAVRDGKIDALMFIGGVPMGALIDLAATPRRRLVLMQSATTLPTLRAAFGDAIYVERTIPRGTYTGINEDIGVVGSANVLVADARMHDDLAHEIARTLFEHQNELAAVHPEARNLTIESAVQGSPIAYHDGAIEYYRERNAWPS
ncbi:MAG TPA: TAXI family TRAP transporter solute-binding subunit [Gemmatimonadaceae bacterium]|nr:TAXI family TRAP transporter solute-binding subunit [Gemmatimonadaceae bacterium]